MKALFRLRAFQRPLHGASANSWEAMGLRPELGEAARSCGFGEPSTPQLLAVPSLLAGKSVAFAAATGTGKTLAFLLPTMQRLREQELESPVLRQAHDCRPRALVLAPTRDLVTQIGAVAKELAHEFRLRVRTAEGGKTKKDNERKLRSAGVDLLVGTPHRVERLRAEGVISLRNVRHVIVDEADEMLLRGFDDELMNLLSKCPPRGGEPVTPQLAFCSATLPADVLHMIRRDFPDVEVLVSNCAHKPPPTLTHELHGFEGGVDKMDELRRLLAPDYDRAGASAADEGLPSAQGQAALENALLAKRRKSSPRALIFCRGVQSARAVQKTLLGAGMPVGGYHGSMPEERRKADLAMFLEDPPRLPLLVCTDLSARGLDFPNVTKVINFDFPATSSLYLHRAGRTARNGKPGHVLSLVHASQRHFAMSIRDAIERKAEVHAVRAGDFRARQRAESGPKESHPRAAVRQMLGQARSGIKIRGGWRAQVR